jgi:hypothetical protein
MAERHRWPSIALGPSPGGRVFMGITGPHTELYHRQVEMIEDTP